MNCPNCGQGLQRNPCAACGAEHFATEGWGWSITISGENVGFIFQDFFKELGLEITSREQFERLMACIAKKMTDENVDWTEELKKILIEEKELE